jgi:hypothetical protein
MYFPYRDSNGLSPTQIQRMMEQQRQYEEACASLSTQHEIAAFEARLQGRALPVPSLPIPPKLDHDVLRSFEPPSASRFYEYQSPNIEPVAVRNAKRARPAVRDMSRGCPACNPDHLEALKPRQRPATRNGRRLHRERHPRPTPPRDGLPLQLNQAYWNVLDEPSVPARRANVYEDAQKPAPFSKLRTGPRMGGIPICRADVIEGRARGQAWFEDEMVRKDDRALYVHEKKMHRRAMTSRAFNAELRDRTIDVAEQAGQEWIRIPAKRAETARVASVLAEKKRLAIKPDEAQAMAELAKYDEKIYREHQAQIKRPIQAMEELLEQTMSRAGRNFQVVGSV